MNFSLLQNTSAFVLTGLIFSGMVGMVFFGRFLSRKWPLEKEGPGGSLNTLLSSLFALFGFILAFTFSMSGNRFENIRNVFYEEANTFTNALLCSDLYPDSIRVAFRADFKKYLEARIFYFDNVMDTARVREVLFVTATASHDLWERAAGESKKPNMLIPSNNMIRCLNDMFDAEGKRYAIGNARIPDPIIYMLFILALTTTFVVGLTSQTFRRKDWVVILGFTILSCMIIYITLDISRPVRGLITVEKGEEMIVDLRRMFR